MLQFLNFAKTEWILISCFEPLLFDVVCQYYRLKQLSQKIMAHMQICKSDQFMKGQGCFEFGILANSQTSEAIDKKKKLQTLEEVKELEFAFHTIDQPFPPILLLHPKTVHAYLISHNKVFDVFLYKTIKVDKKYLHGGRGDSNLPHHIWSNISKTTGPISIIFGHKIGYLMGQIISKNEV